MTKRYPSAPPTAYYIHVANSEGDVGVYYADGVDGTIPPRTVGEGGTYSLIFRTTSFSRTQHPHSGYPKEHWDHYRPITEIGTHAGSYVPKPNSSNIYRWVEQTPSDAWSLLVGLEPAYETPATNGIWALVDGYDDDNRTPKGALPVDLSVTMVATMDEYETHTETTAALQYGT